MLWHRIRGHAIAMVRFASVLHPVGWVCSCGKQWKP